jgi:SAM-dependent methyltransferase
MTSGVLSLRSPKRDLRVHGKSSWFRYYASYSEHFVADILKHLSPARPSTIIDPWNGAGTTTQVAHELGHHAIGFDINPVMVIVAKARLLGANIKPSHLSLAENIVDRATTLHSDSPAHEPLQLWFTPNAASELRSIEQTIQRLLLNKAVCINVAEQSSLEMVSSLAAFFYTALFRTVRAFLKPFQTTNPTWIKTPPKPSRIHPSADAIYLSFLSHVAEMAPADLVASSGHADESEGRGSILLANSHTLPIDSSSAAVTITSPPYCTRIDYAIATKPELAVLGLSMDDTLTRLRRSMIGTTVVSNASSEPDPLWGHTCNTFLSAVYSHGSRASKTYYSKTYVHYFRSIYASLKELDRVLQADGQCVLVVQDSYYKDVHNDLPAVFAEMSRSFGWRLKYRWDFPVERTMAAVNTLTHGYRTQFGAVESVLWFSRN